MFLGGGSGLCSCFFLINLSSEEERYGHHIVKNAKSRLTVENRIVDIDILTDIGLKSALAFECLKNHLQVVKLPNKTEFGVNQ